MVCVHCSVDGYEVGVGAEVYGMAGKSPGGQFNYPAFTFPGPQVSLTQPPSFTADYSFHRLIWLMCFIVFHISTDQNAEDIDIIT